MAENLTTKKVPSNQSSQLAAWLDSTFRKHAGASWKIRLVHSTISGEDGRELQSQLSTYSQEPPSDLAARIVTDAQDDAELASGLSKYVVILEDGGEVIARRALRIQGSTRNTSIAPEEPPTPTGLSAMLMRHLEAKEATSMHAVGKAFQYQDLAVAQLVAANERLVQENTRLVEREEAARVAVERLADKDHERLLEREQLAAQLETRRRALGSLEPAVPVIMAKLLGLPLVPAGQSTSALDSLILSLREDQIGKLQGALDPPQMLALHQIYTEAKERLQKAAPPAAAVPPPEGPST